MNRVCPRHGLEIVETQEAFPGSPCRIEHWCPDWPAGHPVRVWRTKEGVGAQQVVRLSPEAVRIRKRPRRAA